MLVVICWSFISKKSNQYCLSIFSDKKYNLVLNKKLLKKNAKPISYKVIVHDIPVKFSNIMSIYKLLVTYHEHYFKTIFLKHEIDLFFVFSHIS